MTDATAHGQNDKPNGQPETAGAATGSQAASPAQTPQPDLVEAARAEAADYKDKLLRTLADMENLRRRTEREVADSRTYGVSAFARDMVGVADNMRRALDAVDPAVRDTAEAVFKALIEGVELTERELLKALDKHGVKRIEPKGDKFDPNRHQAMYEAPNPDVPSGHVAEVIQAGYTIGERILRPALVGVSKGAAKVAPVQ